MAQLGEIDKAAHARQKRQRPAVVWLTGLSGAGKSAIARAVEARLYALGFHSYVLDGDTVRAGLNRDLSFGDADRRENVRRVAEVARLMTDAGLIVLVALISPFRADRAHARSLFATDEFVEVHVDTPLELTERRDAKGLYRRARRGELQDFTGIDSPYEPPLHPDLRFGSADHTPEQAAAQVTARLAELGVLRGPAG